MTQDGLERMRAFALWLERQRLWQMRLMWLSGLGAAASAASGVVVAVLGRWNGIFIFLCAAVLLGCVFQVALQGTRMYARMMDQTHRIIDAGAAPVAPGERPLGRGHEPGW